MLFVIQWIRDLWLGSAPVEFESSYGLSESVERLKAATRRFVFSVLTRQEAVGVVKEERVSLQRVIPMVGNAFKPFLRGRFIVRDGKVFLIGRFTVHPFAKLFMAFWFGGVGCFMLLALLEHNSKNAPLAVLVGGGMLATGAAFLWFCKWLARNDAAWLSDVIRRALSAKAFAEFQRSGTITRSASFVGRRPTVILAVTGALALMGLISVLGAISGIQSAHTDPQGLVVRYFSDERSRLVAVGYGAAMLILAFGVYRRWLLAWRAGLILLVCGGIYFVLTVLAANGPHFDYRLTIFVCVAGVVVTMFWLRWWHAQRIHFHE
jgi:hypothetical protein